MESLFLAQVVFARLAGDERRERTSLLIFCNCWRRFEMAKKLWGKALAKFETERHVWQEVLDGVREIRAGRENGRKLRQNRMLLACG